MAQVYTHLSTDLLNASSDYITEGKYGFTVSAYQPDNNLTWNSTNSTSYANVTKTSTGDPKINAFSWSKVLWFYAGPMIFSIGLLGNLLIVLVMCRKKMVGTTTSTFLRLMAIADLSVLLTGMLPEWLEMTEIFVFKEVSGITCKMEKFLFYTCADTAIWILVIFTIDRFIAVVFPLQKKRLCLRSRAPFYCLFVFAVFLAKNFHIFWTRGPEYERPKGTNVSVLRTNCGRPLPQFKEFEKFVRPWIAFTLASVLPFLIISICNCFIIRALIEVKQMRNANVAMAATKDKTLIQMTVMCLSASFCFLICVTPSIVLLIAKPYWETAKFYDIAKAINNQLVYVNHSMNFFLYCITGRRFRQELVAMVTCRSVRRRDSPMDSVDNRSLTFSRTAAKATNVNYSSKITTLRNMTRNGDVKYDRVVNLRESPDDLQDSPMIVRREEDSPNFRCREIDSPI